MHNICNIGNDAIEGLRAGVVGNLAIFGFYRGNTFDIVLLCKFIPKPNSSSNM